MSKPDLGVMLAACHGPSLERDHVRHATAIGNRLGLHIEDWTEAYEQIADLSVRPRWDLIMGKSRTDRRRGPKDNPILVSKLRTRIHESGAFKACRAARPRRIAPERWVTWVVFETRDTELLVLNVAIHPHAGVQNARPTTRRVRGYFKTMRKVERLVEQKRLEHGRDLHVVISGDVNSTAAWTSVDYSPVSVFARLGLDTYWHGILAIAHDPRLQRLAVEEIPTTDNGQDHPWLVATFAEKRNESPR